MESWLDAAPRIAEPLGPASFRFAELCRGNFRRAERAKNWSRRDSNSRPPACKAGALPAELRPLKWFDEKERRGARAEARETRFLKLTLCD